MSVSAQKVTEKFIVRKIYQSSRFNNKNSFSENNFFFHISAVRVRKGACTYVDTRPPHENNNYALV